jgi:hypothetical protein
MCECSERLRAAEHERDALRAEVERLRTEVAKWKRDVIAANASAATREAQARREERTALFRMVRDCHSYADTMDLFRGLGVDE